jgi:galactose mutarotase-like enzyme
MHGFLRGKPMTVLRQRITADAATLVLSTLFNGTTPGYPFTVRVELTYRLDASGLDVTVSRPFPS